MEHKYKEGDIVRSKTDPTEPLIIRRYLDRIYYCISKNNPNQKDLVFFERELMADTKVADK